MRQKRIVVIGGGAAGMMAAGRAAEMGARVTLLERMERLGKKILISGNTRCNLTNNRSIDDFILMYGTNGRFLHRAFKHFFREDLLRLLDNYGLMTVTEGDGRIFPESGRSIDVVTALIGHMAKSGVAIVAGARAREIEKLSGGIFSVNTATANYKCNAVILSAGGASYPQTGSAGDGYRLAELLGHCIVPLRPALVPLTILDHARIINLRGISLPNVRVTLFACETQKIDLNLVPAIDTGRGIPGKKARPPVIESRIGDLIFTHDGISGPAVLLMSLAAAVALEHGPVSINIDLVPDKDKGLLEAELQELFGHYGSRHIHTILAQMAPSRLVDHLLRTSGIAPGKIANQISALERKKIVDMLKSLRLDIKGTRPLSEAMITAGGVSLDEVDPQTMESRLVKNLYFCGEILDIDADTGGFNLQAAFSTGYLAGESAAQSN